MFFAARWSVVVIFTVLACACDREAESRAEAKTLLEKLHALSGDGTLTQRQAALDALSHLQLESPEHARARDVCHSAHSQLLQAETAQVAARKTLEEVTRTAQPGTTLSPERGAAIAAELERSNAALAAAKRGFPQCEQETLALTREGR